MKYKFKEHRKKSGIKDESEEQKAIKRGVVAMLHDRLRQACLYHLRRGKISASELDNSRKMYEAYAGLGGNGTVKELYERCLRLPLAQENEI